MAGSVAVSVFARVPEPGNTKRRLIPALGAEGAARLHQTLLNRTLATAHTSAVGPITLWCTPHVEHPVFAELEARLGVALRTQQGADLGARMRHALVQGLETHPAAVVIGSDCPGLTPGDLVEAASALTPGGRVVLGPATDGGYYLLGVSGELPDLFTGVPWGTGKVLEATRRRLRHAACDWRELTERSDIDRPDDLALLGELMDTGPRAG